MFYRLYVQNISKSLRFLKCNRGLSIEFKRTMSDEANELCCIAVGQLTSTSDKNKNVEIVRSLASKAVAKHKAKMLFLPEASDYVIADSKEMLNMAETLDGTTVNKYKEIATQNNLWISVGIHEKENTKVFNTQLLINNLGDIVSSYRKVHLFDARIPGSGSTLSESDYITPGQTIVPPIQTPAGMLGMLICYDLRFPEMSTQLREMGADLLTYPSAFTCKTGEAHWEPLLRARAIETQCYVIAAAQYGQHCEGRPASHGRTLIIDPWGTILAECPAWQSEKDKSCQEAKLAVACIDRSTLTKVRESMPVNGHRRPDIYVTGSTHPPRGMNGFTNMSFADKVIPADTIFYRTRYSFAFTNIRCVVPGHVLVCSNRVASKLTDLNDHEIADLMCASVRVQRAMEKLHDVASSTIVVQDGPEAGRTVPHVHVHILPRKSGDFERNDDVYTALADHDAPDKQDSIPLRPIEEMIAEAKVIRNTIRQMEPLFE